MQPFKAFKANILKLFKFTGDIFSKKTLKKLVAQLNDPNQSDELKAFSAAFGIFIGIIPIWGLQTLAAIFLAVLFRLNKALVIIFSQVSLPPLLPLIVWLSYKAGHYWMGRDTVSPAKTSFQNLNKHLEQYIYGSISLAFAAAMVVGLLTFAMLKLLKIVKQYKLTTALKKAS